MVVADGCRHTVAMDCVAVGVLLERRLADLNFAIHHREELRTSHGKRVAVVFGTSSPLGGASLFSLAMEEARYVPFFLRIEEKGPSSTEVVVWAGGAQGILGFDYGRNGNVGRRILEALPEAWRLRSPG